MSALVDAQRKEDALHARVEKSKRIRRLMDALVAMHLEGLSIRASAQRIGICEDTAEWLLYAVGMTTNVGPLRRRLANADRRHPPETRNPLPKPGRACVCDASWATHGPECRLLAEAVLIRSKGGAR